MYIYAGIGCYQRLFMCTVGYLAIVLDTMFVNDIYTPVFNICIFKLPTLFESVDEEIYGTTQSFTFNRTSPKREEHGILNKSNLFL